MTEDSSNVNSGEQISAKRTCISDDAVIEMITDAYILPVRSMLPQSAEYTGNKAIHVRIAAEDKRNLMLLNKRNEIRYLSQISWEQEIREYCCKLSSFYGQELREMFGSGTRKFNGSDKLLPRIYKQIRNTCCESETYDYDSIPFVGFKSNTKPCWSRIDFDPIGDTCPPVWEVYRARMSNFEAFCAWIWVLCTNGPRQQYVWLWGNGKCGKSTIVEAIRYLFGKSYVSFKIEEIESRFFGASIEGKRLAACHEAKSHLVMSDKFKSLTGDSSICIERKFCDSYEASTKTMYFFTSNNPPEIKNKIEHTRRIILCKLERYTGEAIPDYENILKESLPEFLGYCRSVFNRIYSEGEIQNDKEELLVIASDVAARTDHIFNKYFELDATHFVPLETVYQKLDFAGLKSNYASHLFAEWETRFSLTREYPNGKPIIRGIRAK